MASSTTDRRLGLTGGTAIKAPCKAATTANVTLSGEQTVDGVACVTGDRVLVKSQTSSVDNGIYAVDSGTWTRDLDFDGANDVVAGTICMVLNGSTNGNTYWRVTTTGTITFGSSAITFAAALAGDAAMVSFLQAGTGAVSITLRARGRLVIYVEDFGAVGDASTDDSTAINFAADYCAAIADFGKWKVVLKFTPGKRYRVAAASVKLYNYVRYEMYGSELVGPITSYGRITGATAIPADTDWAAQTAGAAMADTGLADALDTPYTQSIMVDGLAANGFRYGICVRRVFNCSRIKDSRFVSCDIGIFLYGGAQLPSIENPVFNSCGAGIVVGATCMTTNHPWKAKDMNFVAGVHITGEKGGDTQGVAVSDDVDTWFAAAILRASSSAFRAGVNFGTFVPQHAAALLVTGWVAYLPARTNNGNQGTVFKGFVTTACDRGMYYSRNDQGTEVGDLSAEFYTSLNPHKATETNSFVVFETPDYAIADKINTEPATSGSVYDKTVKVYRSLSNTVFWRRDDGLVFARSIRGKIDPLEFASISYLDNETDTTRTRYENAFRRLSVYPSVNWELVAGLEAVNEGLRLVYPLSGDGIGWRPWVRRIPRQGAANTTTDMILDTGGSSIDDRGGSVMGKLTVYSCRLDTGAMDFGQYTVRMPYRFGFAEVLSANASTNDLSFQVVNGSLNYRRGDVVTLNAADNYLVESGAGNVITTAQPLRNNYTAGQTVTKIAQIVATITAPASQFALSVNVTALRITNSLGAGTPIKFFAVFESFSPYTFAS